MPTPNSRVALSRLILSKAKSSSARVSVFSGLPSLDGSVAPPSQCRISSAAVAVPAAAMNACHSWADEASVSSSCLERYRGSRKLCQGQLPSSTSWHISDTAAATSVSTWRSASYPTGGGTSGSFAVAISAPSLPAAAAATAGVLLALATSWPESCTISPATAGSSPVESSPVIDKSCELVITTRVVSGGDMPPTSDVASSFKEPVMMRSIADSISTVAFSARVAISGVQAQTCTI